jgi:hypothetical protein
VNIVLREDALQGSDGIVTGELAKEQASEPSPAVEGSNTFVSVVPANPGLELGSGNQFDNLGENSVLSHKARTSWGKHLLVSQSANAHGTGLFSILQEIKPDRRGTPR